MNRALSGELRLPCADDIAIRGHSPIFHLPEVRRSSNEAKVPAEPVTLHVYRRFINQSEECSVQQVRDGQKMPGALSRRLIGHLRGDGEPNGETDRPGL